MMLLVVVFEDKLFVEMSFPQNWGVLRAKLFGLLQKYPHAEEIGVFHVWLVVLVLGFLWIRSKQNVAENSLSLQNYNSRIQTVKIRQGLLNYLH